MNIISNTCVGGHYQKNVLEVPFQNPFVWTRLTLDDYLFLNENYDTIDFSRITEKYLAPERKNTDFTIPYIQIDGKLLVEFVHVRLDK